MLNRFRNELRVGLLAILLVFVPIFAYVYGNFARYLLRLFRLE